MTRGRSRSALYSRGHPKVSLPYIDPTTGEVRTEGGRPVTLPWALLLRRDDVDLLEILETSGPRQPEA